MANPASTTKDHNPKGNPCRLCGLGVAFHRVKHMPDGDPCSCGVPLFNHRIRTRSHREKKIRNGTKKSYYIGVDGEGQGREFHKYVLLAASDSTGKHCWHVEDFNGLSTKKCLNFLLKLPLHAKAFSYAFNYDLTKMLSDLPDESIYRLMRPELRQRPGKEAVKGPFPIKWRGYTLNLQGTKFTVRRRQRMTVIWDIFKFFGSKFVSALKEWKVGDKERLEHMQMMKDKRSEFDKETPEAVRRYCFDECQYMAELAKKLTEAHTNVGLKLTAYYGAGSSASAMLKKMGIKEKLVPASREMLPAVASAFFGGRFENSVIGPIGGRIYNYDISSAYPYELCTLPCLIHGTWRHTSDEKDLWKTRTAVVHYRLHKSAENDVSWGPLPFRTTEGAICFPNCSGGGWVWREEYLRAQKLFAGVEFQDAWVYDCSCDCNPFKDIPSYYLERIRIGKEGPGIVIKLGMNSCYGKLAQSIGQAQFNSWIWAGLITSGTRAQILEIIGKHVERRNVLMVATDGIQTREKIDMPKPRDTGTYSVSKPLGGWEEKVIDKGVFYARPGIYFPMNPTVEEIKDVRGRGVGKGVVLENWQKIVESYQFYGADRNVQVANVTRFIGAKTAVHKNPTMRTYTRSNQYGQWITRGVDMSFNPMPKRECVNEDGITLKVRSMPMNVESMPYSKAILSQEAKALRQAMQEMLEQPDSDFADYELEEQVAS